MWGCVVVIAEIAGFFGEVRLRCSFTTVMSRDPRGLESMVSLINFTLPVTDVLKKAIYFYTERNDDDPPPFFRQYNKVEAFIVFNFVELPKKEKEKSYYPVKMHHVIFSCSAYNGEVCLGLGSLVLSCLALPCFVW